MIFKAQSIQIEYFYQLVHLSSFNQKSILIKRYKLGICQKKCEFEHIMI